MSTWSDCVAKVACLAQLAAVGGWGRRERATVTVVSRTIFNFFILIKAPINNANPHLQVC